MTKTWWGPVSRKQVLGKWMPLRSVARRGALGNTNLEVHGPVDVVVVVVVVVVVAVVVEEVVVEVSVVDVAVVVLNDVVVVVDVVLDVVVVVGGRQTYCAR
mmetsp:Transcript_76813/g.228984  ORF Transcript_76813/g.228984 Transcript_76813/m.228984 type:complete len:101 (-) Transcript_76813:239-541(-)